MSRRHPGWRLGSTARVLEALIPTILAQKVVAADAHRAYRTMVRRFGQPAPGTADLCIPPTPAVLQRAGTPSFHLLGVERRRADTVLRACRQARRLERAAHEGTEALDRRLQAITGIGPWTSAGVRIQALGDPDAVPVGDHHLPRLVVWALTGRDGGDDEAMLACLAPFAGHRWRVVRLLRAARLGPARRGPRPGPSLPSLQGT